MSTILEERRKYHTIERCVSDLKNTIIHRIDSDGPTNAVNFECSYGILKSLWSDVADKHLENCVKELGFFDLSDTNFTEYLDDGTLETIKPIVERALNSKPEDPKQLPAAVLDVDKAKPFQDMLDLLDPGMFEIVEMGKTGKNTGVIKCKKIKTGKSNTVDKINALGDDIAKCKITSDELVITVFRESLDDMLDFAIQVFDSAMVVVNPENGAANTAVDYNEIAKQYGISVSELVDKMKTPEGQAWISKKMSELARENASDPVVQELKKHDPEPSTNKPAAPKQEETKQEESNPRKLRGQDALNVAVEVMKKNGIEMRYQEGLHGLFKVDFFVNGMNTTSVAFDVNNRLLSPELKWSPTVPTTAYEAREAAWFSLEETDSLNLLIWYAMYPATEAVLNYPGKGRLYNDEYKLVDTYVSLNEVFRSPMVYNKSDDEKYQLLKNIAWMVFNTDLVTESVKFDPNSYYRLFKYTSPTDFELISDGRTRHWMNGGKPLPVKKSYTLKYKDGKWEASGYIRPEKNKNKDKKKKDETPKAAQEATA